MENKNKISFQITLYLLISIGIFLFLTVSVTSFLIDNFYENQKRIIENKLSTLFISLIMSSLERYDYYGVEKNCQKFLSEELVSYVYIYDNSGFLINQSYKEKFYSYSPFINEYIIIINNENGKKIGEAKIGYNFSTFYYSQLKIKIILFIIAVMLIFSVSFTIIWIISKNLSKPLNQLLFSINKITGGDYNFKLDITSDDEIGEISSSFNAMTLKLNSVISLIEGIVKNLPSAIIFINNNFKILLWNKMAENIFNINSNMALNKLIYEIDPYFIDLEDEILKVFNRFETRIINQKLLKSDKFKDRYHTISLIPLFSIEHETNLEGIIIKIDDETENIKKMNMMNQIQKMESIQILGSGIAHDFNNILGGITGALSLMKQDLQEKKMIKKEELTDYLEILELSTQKASLIVNQLMLLSKKKEVNFTVVNLFKCIQDIYKICQHSFDKSVEIELSYKEDRCYIYGVESQIEQAILNLCINGYQAMTIMKGEDEKKGGKLELKIDKINRENKDYWLLIVKDEGVGIEQENLNKIFDPFFSTKDKAISSGLGLTMVYNIVENHNGFIEVNSKIGFGTEIKLYLPSYEVLMEEDKKQHEKIIDNKKFRGKKAIIIDDEDILRKVLRNILEKLEFEIIEVKDPEEFMANFIQHQNEISIIILDLIMPKISGYEIYMLLEKEYEIDKKNIPIILTTGLSQDERIVELRNSKNIHFLFKPYTLEDLVKILDNIF